MSRVMKDSWIKWIWKIPENWTYARIKNFGDETHPYPIWDGDHWQIKPENYQNEWIPYIRVQNIWWGMPLLLDDVVYISEEVNDKNKKSILHPWDILVAKTGATFWKTWIIPEDMEQANTTSSVWKVTVSKKYSNKYVFYCLGSDVCYKQMELIANQKSAQPWFNIDDLVDFYLPFPSTEEQKKIANYLDERCGVIDTQKENYEKSIELLNEYKQSLITETVTKGLNKNVKMKDTSIGEIPSHWEFRRLKYFVDEFSKWNWITKEDVKEDWNIQCVRYGEIYTKYDKPFNKTASLTNLDIINSPKHIYKWDILFACTWEKIEEIWRNTVYMWDEPCLAWWDIIIAKHHQNPIFLNYTLNSTVSQSQKSKWKFKLKVVHISSTNIWNILTPMPPIEEQKQIADYLDDRCSKIDKLISYREQMIEKLDEYKKSLIYECVTGKKEIK